MSSNEKLRAICHNVNSSLATVEIGVLMTLTALTSELGINHQKKDELSQLLINSRESIHRIRNELKKINNGEITNE